MKILIAYGGQTGATKSIAERIEARIATANLGSVVVEPVEHQPAIDDFDVLIIGSCIHRGSWVGKSQRFIKSNASSLHDNPKPTWAFSVGMPPDKLMAAEEKSMNDWLRKRIALRGHKLFLGKYEEKEMGWVFKMFFHCFGGKFEDKRNWEAMDEWADGILRELRVDMEGGEQLQN